VDWLSNMPSWLASISEDPEGLRIGYSVLLGTSVFVLALALYLLVGGVLDPLRKRVHSVNETGAAPVPKPGRKGIFHVLGGLLMPKRNSKRANTESLLRYAGFRSESAVQVFYGIKLGATVLLPVMVFGGFAVSRVLPLADAVPYLLATGVLGFFLPDIVLARLARRRQDRLRRALPDAMDLLVVCSEAGLGLASGIQRVAGELSLTYPDLSDELSLFSMQTRAGMDNRAALKDLEERTGLEDIQVLVAMLLQSMRFGTSIADTLRIYSDELRDKRLQRAQEKAARISTWMIFPLALFIMPSFLLVILGPAILGALRAVSGSGIFQ